MIDGDMNEMEGNNDDKTGRIICDRCGIEIGQDKTKRHYETKKCKTLNEL